jgi:hypothetical protein
VRAEHDPQKWKPVFPRDKRVRVCAEIMLKQEMDHDAIPSNRIMIYTAGKGIVRQRFSRQDSGCIDE